MQGSTPWVTHRSGADISLDPAAGRDPALGCGTSVAGMWPRPTRWMPGWPRSMRWTPTGDGFRADGDRGVAIGVPANVEIRQPPRNMRGLLLPVARVRADNCDGLNGATSITDPLTTAD
jgi:hypothetical protein